jgi:phosphate uptake regulator
MFRTLVRSGNTSHVISLPIRWIRENNLKPGETVSLEYATDGSLIVRPTELKTTRKAEEITINIDGKDFSDLKNEIISSYIDDYKNIHLIGKEIKQKSTEIVEFTQSLIALGIIEQTQNHIIIRNFFDYKDTSIQTISKKQDIIIRAIFSELKIFFESGLTAKNYQDIDELNNQINKLNLLGLKITKKIATDTNIARLFELNNLEILLTSKINFFLENIAHHLKIVAQDLVYLSEKSKNIKGIKNSYLITERNYLNLMDNYYKKNKSQLSKLVREEKKAIEKINNLHRINKEILIGKVLENLAVIQEYLIRMTKLCLLF